MSVKDYIGTLPADEPVVFVCGSFAHGAIDASFCDDELAISEYPLSASVVCGKLCCAFEEAWGIV
jgi:rRNA small subunit pseudouridine methyltransferase Nep1